VEALKACVADNCKIIDTLRNEKNKNKETKIVLGGKITDNNNNNKACLRDGEASTNSHNNHHPNTVKIVTAANNAKVNEEGIDNSGTVSTVSGADEDKKRLENENGGVYGMTAREYALKQKVEALTLSLHSKEERAHCHQHQIVDFKQQLQEQQQRTQVNTIVDSAVVQSSYVAMKLLPLRLFSGFFYLFQLGCMFQMSPYTSISSLSLLCGFFIPCSRYVCNSALNLRVKNVCTRSYLYITHNDKCTMT
jgi:hypothetical protein